MCAVKLVDILDKTNGLYQLADRLNWDYLTQELGPYYLRDPLIIPPIAMHENFVAPLWPSVMKWTPLLIGAILMPC